jgi:CheY-like chemotaxis protein
MATALTGTAVLFVDDDLDIVEAIDCVLGDEGANVRTATTAREALRVLETWIPDVMLLDLAMPEMDGYELLRVIRRERSLRGIPAVAVTGYAGERERQRAQAAGFAEHVAKPSDLTTLVHLIRQLTPRRSDVA